MVCIMQIFQLAYFTKYPSFLTMFTIDKIIRFYLFWSEGFVGGIVVLDKFVKVYI
jgi:hypothetical protein